MKNLPSMHLLFLLLFTVPASAQNNVQLIKDFETVAGNWKGILTYLDYSTGKPYTMSANVKIARIGKTSHFEFVHMYPQEKSANFTDTLIISEDGRYLNKETIKTVQKLDDGTVQIITEKVGKDGNQNKDAMLRQTYTLSKEFYSKRKDVLYTGEIQWIKRHEYLYQKNNVVFPLARIDSVMQVAHRNGIFNGNIVIAQKGKIMYQKSFGYADASWSIPLNLSMKFDIGSICKEFNGTGILWLAEKGKLSFSSTVADFFPEFGEWAKKVQIKHLINYTSGIPTIARNETNSGDAFLLEYLKNLQALSFEPGTQYDYNYFDVFIQQRLIERVTKMKYADFVEKYLFMPAGMQGAAIDYLVTAPDMAQAFNDEGVVTPYPANFTGYARMPIHDLLLWEQALWGRQIVSQSSLETLSATFATGETSLGRVTVANNGFVKHSHQGSNYNYEALVSHSFEDEITIVLMTNSQQLKVQALNAMLLQLLKNEAFSVPKKSVYLSVREKLLKDVNAGLAFYDDIKTNHQDRYDFHAPIPDLLNAGKYLQRRDYTESAIKVFDTAVKLTGRKEDLSYGYELLGDAYTTLQELNKAEENYKKAVELDPNNKNAASKYAEILK